MTAKKLFECQPEKYFKYRDASELPKGANKDPEFMPMVREEDMKIQFLTDLRAYVRQEMRKIVHETPENDERIFVCEECRATFTDAEARNDCLSKKWGA